MTSNTDWIVQTLIDDENMPADLASLYPAASRIADAAAQFVDKADQAIEKKGLFGRQAEVVAKCVDICQHVVKEGAAISRLLRNRWAANPSWTSGGSGSRSGCGTRRPTSCTPRSSRSSNPATRHVGRRMSDGRTYMARCRQCGWLTGPTSLDVAIETANRHRRQIRTHDVSWVPIKANITVGGVKQ